MKLSIQKLILAITILAVAACSKKNIEPVDTPKPATVTDVYIAGNILAANNINVAAYWKNGTLVKLVNDSTSNSYAYNIAVSGNDVYISGVIYNSSMTASQVVYWKNGIITKLTGINGSIHNIPAIAVNGSDVYVTGEASITFQLPNVATAYWKNGIPQTLKLVSGDGSVDINSLVVNGNDVYISGSVAGGRIDAAYWKNGEQIKLITTSISPGSISWGMALQGNDVYIAGTIGTDAGYWKNGIFTKSLTDYSSINAIAVKGSDVYIAGSKYVSLQTTNPQVTPVYWKNGVVVNQIGDSVSGSAPYLEPSATGIVLNGDDVYVIGNFKTTISSYWKNNALVPFTTNTKATGYGICVVSK